MSWKQNAEWALFPEKLLKESELQVLSLKMRLLRKKTPQEIFGAAQSIASKPFRPFFEHYRIERPKTREYLQSLKENLRGNAFEGTRALLDSLIASEDQRSKAKQKKSLTAELDDRISKQLISQLNQASKGEDFSVVPATLLLGEFEART